MKQRLRLSRLSRLVPAITLSLILLTTSLALSAPRHKRVKRADWVAMMRRGLPDAFCKDGTYFRECFHITEAACRKTAEKVANRCVAKYEPKLPKVLELPKDGRHWGGKIGGCAGDAMDTINAPKKRKTKKCNDLDYWVKVQREQQSK